MSSVVYLTEAHIGVIAEALAATSLPAISSYELSKAFYLKTSEISQRNKAFFRAVVDQLQRLRLLSCIPLQGGAEAYLLFGHSNATAKEIACSLDPFAYLSHLSAMEYHGLTDRFPKIVFMSTPSQSDWRQQAQEKMRKDLGDHFDAYISGGFPKLGRPNLTKIGKSTVEFYERSQLGAFRHVPGSPLRVATIGRVFLDMIREPQLCGGIQHVIDVISSESKRHLRSIVDEVDRHGKPIDKVRMGYLLTEVSRLSDSIVDEWEQYAQRGGSRKLDSEGEYSPTYSERWKLSINVPSLTMEHDSDEH